MEETKNLNLPKVVDTKILEDSNVDIVNEVIRETDIDKVKDLTNLFNLNIAKKNMVRVMQLNDMLDKVNEQALARLNKRPDEISNKELLDFMTAIQGSIEKSTKILDTVDTTPIIQLTQQNNEVNINVTDTLDREAKTKVLDAIKALLNTAKNNNNSNIINIEENNESEGE